MSDLDEFLEIVGNEALPDYHFYLTPDGKLWEVRINDHRPKKPWQKWPLVWRHYALNPGLESKEILEKIYAVLKDGKANRIDHISKK